MVEANGFVIVYDWHGCQIPRRCKWVKNRSDPFIDFQLVKHADSAKNTQINHMTNSSLLAVMKGAAFHLTSNAKSAQQWRLMSKPLQGFCEISRILSGCSQDRSHSNGAGNEAATLRSRNVWSAVKHWLRSYQFFANREIRKEIKKDWMRWCQIYLIN